MTKKPLISFDFIVVAKGQPQQWKQYLSGKGLMYMRINENNRGKASLVFAPVEQQTDAEQFDYYPLDKLDTWHAIFSGTHVGNCN